jgi:hypothetical protein
MNGLKLSLLSNSNYLMCVLCDVKQIFFNKKLELEIIAAMRGRWHTMRNEKFHPSVVHVPLVASEVVTALRID